jgi:hypothetical protein
MIAKAKTVYVKDNSEINRLNDEINRLRAQVNDLENRKPEKEIVTIDNSRVVTFPYLVNFTVNTADVVNREKVNLETVAAMIKATPRRSTASSAMPTSRQVPPRVTPSWPADVRRTSTTSSLISTACPLRSS